MEGRKSRKIERVELLFGELQNVDEAVFREGLSEFISGELRVADDAFVIRTEEARFRCNGCSAEWPLSSVEGLTEDELEAIHFLPESAHVYISCPRCGSPDYILLTGRGVTISAVEFIEK